jgi:hypothetical protein
MTSTYCMKCQRFISLRNVGMDFITGNANMQWCTDSGSPECPFGGYHKPAETAPVQ